MTGEEYKEEKELRALVSLVQKKGIAVRREKLSRGRSFRVKSGACEVFGQNVLFVDKELPAKQQISLLLDYFIERGIAFGQKDLELLSAGNQQILVSRGLNVI